MQAVADRLGVDRKALNHHVGDRNGLLRLVARTAFESRFAAADVNSYSDWRDAVVIWATAVCDSVVATGAAVDYAPLEGETGTLAHDRLEDLLETLLDAGFPAESAGRGLRLLASMAWAYARDVILGQQDGGHPQLLEMQRALDRQPKGSYAALREVVASSRFGYDTEQFAFQLRIFVQGMEEEHRTSTASA